MISNKKRYYLLTAYWREKYLPKNLFGDPSVVKAARARTCKKCGSRQTLTRHHKGHEYVFAQVEEIAYAERYIQFRDDDVVVLCERCHLKIHRLYKWILQELNAYLKELEPIRDEKTQLLTFKYKPSHRALESFRLRLVSKCERWLKSKMRKWSRQRR